MSGSDPVDPIEAIFAYPDKPKPRRGDEAGAQRHRLRREPPGATGVPTHDTAPAPVPAETVQEPATDPPADEAAGRRDHVGSDAARHAGAGLVCGSLMIALRLWAQVRFPALFWHAPLGVVILAGVALALAVAAASARHGGFAPLGVGIGAAVALGAAEIAAPVGLAVVVASLSLAGREED